MSCGCMQGGAVFIGIDGLGNFNQCEFTSNQASMGGAVYIGAGEAEFKQCEFTSNQAVR